MEDGGSTNGPRIYEACNEDVLADKFAREISVGVQRVNEGGVETSACCPRLRRTGVLNGRARAAGETYTCIIRVYTGHIGRRSETSAAAV